MYKKAALRYLLHEQLEKLGLPLADKLTLRAALADPNAYRVRMGQPSFSDGAAAGASMAGSSIERSSIERSSIEGSALAAPDLTWIGALSISGKAFFHFVEAG